MIYECGTDINLTYKLLIDKYWINNIPFWIHVLQYEYNWFIPTSSACTVDIVQV